MSNRSLRHSLATLPQALRVPLVALALGLVGSVTLGTAGCSVFQGQQSVGTYIDDKTITAAVKTKLVEDKSTSAMAIDVDTQDGNVILSGFAKTAAEKSQAEALARSTKGVKSVRNLLVVRP